MYRPLPEWETDAFYESTFEQRVERSLGVEFDPPLLLSRGTYFVCEGVEHRSFVSEDYGGDAGFGGTFVILQCLDPRDRERVVRLGYWPAANADDQRRYRKIVEPLVVLALAATGLGVDDARRIDREADP